MIVCICKGINETRIREAVADGHTTVKELRRHLGVASKCAKCACHAKEVIGAELEKYSASLDINNPAEVAQPAMFIPQPA